MYIYDNFFVIISGWCNYGRNLNGWWCLKGNIGS